MHVLTARALVTFLQKKVAKPSVKTFILAYLYVVLPKIISTTIRSVKKQDFSELRQRVSKTLLRAIHPLRFPVFAAKLIAGINILEPLVKAALKRMGGRASLFWITLVSSFLSSLATFPAFQKHVVGRDRYYSLDLTLLVVTRALDTTLSSTLSKLTPAYLSGTGDGLMFVAACTFIMYAWFFYPETLPPSYRNWITSAANMDPEIVELMKKFKEKKAVYGIKNDDHLVLENYCKRYGQPTEVGDLAINTPLSCFVVHAFQTENCELHALWRFKRGFEFAIKIYGPLNALMLLFPKKIPMKTRIARAIAGSVRSSCFLGAFIGLYWYAVCLSRRRLFPKLFPEVPLTRWDDEIAPAAGAVACGFSSFVETAQRRKELALFVAPRALGTFIPTIASPTNLKVEATAFAAAMAILVAYLRLNPKKVRGIFGKGLQAVF